MDEIAEKHIDWVGCVPRVGEPIEDFIARKSEVVEMKWVLPRYMRSRLPGNEVWTFRTPGFLANTDGDNDYRHPTQWVIEVLPGTTAEAREMAVCTQLSAAWDLAFKKHAPEGMQLFPEAIVWKDYVICWFMNCYTAGSDRLHTVRATDAFPNDMGNEMWWWFVQWAPEIADTGYYNGKDVLSCLPKWMADLLVPATSHTYQPNRKNCFMKMDRL